MPNSYTSESGSYARLAVEDVIVIRSLHKIMKLSMTEIGRRFGVPRETVRDIVNRKTWKHIPASEPEPVAVDEVVIHTSTTDQ